MIGDDRFWLKADLPGSQNDVRFAPESGPSGHTRRMSASDPERTSSQQAGRIGFVGQGAILERE